MKKILILIIVPYLLLLGGMFYFYFGPVFTGYQSLNWKGVETVVPGGFKVEQYHRNGWDVYSLKKMTAFIQVALKPGVDARRLAEKRKAIMYKSFPDEKSIFFVARMRKAYEAVFATSVEGTAIYIGITSPAVFSAVHVVEKLTQNLRFNGQKIPPPQPQVPAKHYFTDFLFSFGMLVPLLVVILIFYLSGAKPSETHFRGEVIRCEESYVSFTSIKKYRRKGSFCYLVLTDQRLVVFLFRRPVWELKLTRDSPGQRPDIKISGKKIIMEKEKETMTLRPEDIEKWKPYLSQYLY